MDLIDTLAEKECRIWCRLEWAEDEALNLVDINHGQYPDLFYPEAPEGETWDTYNLVQESHLDKNGIPSWFFYEMSETGLSDILRQSFTWDHWDLGDVFDEPWTEFGLRHGIAPFQPFLLSIPRPHYRGPDHDGEYYVEYNWDVLRIVPWPKEKVFSEWNKYLLSFGDIWDTTPSSCS